MAIAWSSISHQVDDPVDRQLEFLVRPLEHLDRLAVIHMHEFRADDPLRLCDQPLLDPLVEEGEVFPSFVDLSRRLRIVRRPPL